VAAAVRDEDKLKMFALGYEEVQPVSLVPCSAGVVPGLARSGQTDTL
jgi:hypothetical protein